MWILNEELIMSLMVDLILLFLFAVGYLVYYSRGFKKRRMRREIPYIVLIYLFSAPYRGLMAKSVQYTDLVIDIVLLGYFFYLCTVRKIHLCLIHMVWIIFFLSASLLYALNNTGFLGIIRIQEVKFHIGIALLIVILTSTITSKDGIIQIVDTFRVNSFIIAFLDILMYALTRQLIISSSLSNRNFVSIYEYLGLLAMLYVCRKNKKIYLWIGTGIIIFDLVLMKSSSVFLGLLGAIMIWFLKKMDINSKKLYKLIVLALTMIICTTIAIISTPKAIDNKYVNMIQSVRASNDYTRTLIWEEAMGLARENIIFGIGPDNFRDSRTKYMFPTHNDYIKVLTETGLLGLTGFLFFILASIRYTINIYDKEVRRYIFSALLGLLIFILFHGYINYVVFWIAFCIPYWWRHIEKQSYA